MKISLYGLTKKANKLNFTCSLRLRWLKAEMLFLKAMLPKPGLEKYLLVNSQFLSLILN